MKWIISTFALFTLLLVGGVLWLAYADHEDLAFLEPTLEQYVQELTGREFSINGQFELEVGEYVTLVAENIQLGNVEWGIEPMARVERLAVTVDYFSLLDGTIIIRELDLQGATLLLQSLEDGRNNWTFGDPTAETSEIPFRVLLEQARLDDIAITYGAQDLERPLEIAIVYARQEHLFVDDSLRAHVIATVNGRSIEIDAELGTFENLLEGKNVEYDLRGRFDSLAIHSHGIIDDLLDPSKPTITLSVASPNVDDVTAMLGLADYGDGSLQLDAYLTPHEDKVELTLRGNLAGLNIDASGRASELRALRQVEFDVTANGPHLGRFLNVIGIDDVPDEPFRLEGHLRRSDSQLVINNVVLEVGQATFRLAGTIEGFPGLDAANVQLNVSGPELEPFHKLLDLPGSFTGPFELDVTIEQSAGGVDVVDALLETVPVRLQLHGPLGDPPNYDGTRFEIVASGANLNTVASAIARSGPSPLPMVPEDPFSVQATVEISTDGFTVEDLRAEVGDPSLSDNANVTAHDSTAQSFIKDELKGSLGGTKFTGALSVVLVDPRPNIDVDLDFEVLDLRDWQGEADTSASATLAIPDYRLPLAQLAAIDGTLEIAARTLRLTNSTFTDVLVRATIIDGALFISELDVVAPRGGLHGTLRVVPTDRAANVHLNVSGPELASFTKQLGLPGSFNGPFELDIAIQQSTDGADVVDALLATVPVRLQLHGPLGDPPNYDGTRFEIVASGANLNTVASIVSDSGPSPLPMVPEDPFSVQATVDVTADGFAIKDLRAEVRDASLSGSARVTAQQGEFAVNISLPDLQNLEISYPGWQPEAVAFGLQAQGAWNADRWTIDSSHISLGEATLEWNGVFDFPPDLSATDLELSVDIPSLANLGMFDGERLPERGLTLDAHFNGTVRSFVMDKLKGSLGGTSFTGALSVDLIDPRPRVDANLDFAVLDLRDWEEDPEEVVDESATATRVIPDYPLPLTQFATIDGTLRIAARTVRLTDITFTDALIQATLLDGGLTVSELDMVAPRGRLDGTLKVLPTDRGADVHFTFGGKDLGLNLGGDPTDLVQAVIFDVDVDLSGHGATIRELAASLSGRASLESDGGRIRNRGISLYTGFGGELLSALNPMAKEIPYTQITCARVSFEATDGRFETSPTIVVQTERINLVSKGAIDLKTEKIDFTFTSKPRKRLSISASELINPYLRVAGTLGKPRLTMNRRGTAVSATAAVATAGLSILARAAWDRTFRKKDPCE